MKLTVGRFMFGSEGFFVESGGTSYEFGVFACVETPGNDGGGDSAGDEPSFTLAGKSRGSQDTVFLDRIFKSIQRVDIEAGLWQRSNLGHLQSFKTIYASHSDLQTHSITALCPSTYDGFYVLPYLNKEKFDPVVSCALSVRSLDRIILEEVLFLAIRETRQVRR